MSGLSPDVLHQVLLESNPSDPNGKGKERETDQSPWVPITSSQDATGSLPRVVYEINTESDRLEPRLRLLVNASSAEASVSAIPLPVLTALEHEYGNSTPDLPLEENDSKQLTEASIEAVKDPSEEVAQGRTALSEETLAIVYVRSKYH